MARQVERPASGLANPREASEDLSSSRRFPILNRSPRSLCPSSTASAITGAYRAPKLEAVAAASTRDEDPFPARHSVDHEVVIGWGSVETGPSFDNSSRGHLRDTVAEEGHRLIEKVFRAGAVRVGIDDLTWTVLRDLHPALSKEGGSRTSRLRPGRSSR